MRDRHYLEILNWVKSYLPDQEAEGLANQIHHLSLKYSRKAVAWGIVAGWVSITVILLWIG